MQPNKVWILAAIGLLAITAGCSGGGSRSTPSVPNQAPNKSQPNSAGKNLALHFTIPGTPALATSRQLQYRLTDWAGTVVTITQASPSPLSTTLTNQEQFDFTGGNGGQGGGQNCDNVAPASRHCTIYMSAKIGVDNVEIDAYDNTPLVPGQIATPSGGTPSCKTKELHTSIPYCVQVGSARGLGVGIVTGVTVTAGVNNVTINMQPIADSFQVNGQSVFTIFSFPLCDPELIGGGLPQQDTCSEDQFGPATAGPSGGGLAGSSTGRPEYVISINGNKANFPALVPIGFPGILPEDAAQTPIVGQFVNPTFPCGPADNWYNAFDVSFFEGGALETGFTNGGGLYKQPCGGSFAIVGVNGQQTDTEVSTDDRYEELYSGRGGPGLYNANGTVVCGGEGAGCGPYFGIVDFRPHSIDPASGLGPLPNICGGCSASAPGNAPLGGFGVGYQWSAADWRQVSADVSPLYGVVVADSRCGNPSQFGPAPCGGTLPANDDTANSHSATMVLGGYQELGVIVAAQFYPPTGSPTGYVLTLHNCPGDLTYYVPNNGIMGGFLSGVPGYTDNNGKETFGGQIFVIRAGRTLFTTALNCYATISDGFNSTDSGVQVPNGQILISNPTTTSVYPGIITI
jgi:hypothetical protein